MMIHWWYRRPARRRLKVPLLLWGGVLLLALGTVSAVAGQGRGVTPAFLFMIGAILLGEGLVRRSGIEEADNDDVARQRMAETIRKARHRVVVTSRALGRQAFSRWGEGEIPKILEEKLASEEGFQVDIVCGELIAEESKPLLHGWLLKYPNFRLYQWTGDPEPHGMLVDDLALRMEKKSHDLGEYEEGSLYIENPTISAALFLASFERLKAAARRVCAEDLS